MGQRKLGPDGLGCTRSVTRSQSARTETEPPILLVAAEELDHESNECEVLLNTRGMTPRLADYRLDARC